MPVSAKGTARVRLAHSRPSSRPLARRREPALVAALLAVALAGCAGLAVEPRYRALRTELDRRDTLPPAPEPVSFASSPALEREALVREVLARNPSLRAARAAWRGALAEFPQAVALDDPMAAYGVAPRSLASSGVRAGHIAELSQTLPAPGKLRLRGEAALARAEASSHEHEALRLELATAASVLFDAYAFQTRALEITREHVALLDDLHRIAIARYEAGEGSQQDPLQAEVERARLLRREIALRADLGVTVHQLDRLLHRRAADPLPPPAPPPAPDPEELASVEERAAAEALAAALARRPELRAAEAQVAAGNAAVSLAFRDFLPDLTVRVAYEGLMQESELRPVLGVSFPIPLQMRRRRAVVEAASAQLEAARSQRESVEDAVRFEVHSAIERLRDAREAFGLFREQIVPASEDRLVAARAGYEAGRDSFLAVIEAERDLRDARIGYEETLADVHQRLAELHRATGRVPGAPKE